MKRPDAERLGIAGSGLMPTTTMQCGSGDKIVQPATAVVTNSSCSTVAEAPTGTRLGHVLWTLSKENSTAEARRWITPAGLEFELQIWTGPRVQGEEDLSLVQVFSSDEPLADTALAKKRQLEAAGWIEDIKASAL